MNGHKILLLEDQPHDVYLTRVLLRSVAPIVGVDNRKDYEAMLDAINIRFDLILSDVRVPGFHEFEHLEMAKSRRPGVPFIYISGSVGDEQLAQALRFGAHDVIQKDRVARLEFVIRKLFGMPVD